MKIDRFVKISFGLIIVLLAINCAKKLDSANNSNESSNNSLPFERSVEAAAPGFLQVGRTYFGSNGASGFNFTVVEVQSSGWVKAKDESGRNIIWVNPSSLAWIQQH